MLGRKYDTKTQSAAPARNIEILEQGLRSLCEGNFLTKIELPEGDALMPIAKLINEYSQNNAGLLMRAAAAINESVAACLEKGEELNRLTEAMETQAENISQMSLAIAQLSASVNELAQSTCETSDYTVSGKNYMELADKSVQQAAAETEISKSGINFLSRQVSDLHTATARIDQLVSVVKSVSSQTNLLALNAAIEAARAGEYGRGFSVVAEEVRKLADQSNQSVEEITCNLTQIRNEVEEIKAQFQNMDKSFQNNAEFINSASNNVQKLLEVFEYIRNAIQNLSPIAQEQSSSFEEMSASVETISEKTNSINETVQKCNRDIFYVLNSFNDIRTEISSFKLNFTPEQIIDLSKTDHLLWKTRISYMLSGVVSLKEENVMDHRACRLGKWYFGDGQSKYGHLGIFKNLDSIHKEFHSKCANAIKYYKLKDIPKARQLAVEINDLSEKVLRILDEIKHQAK